MGILPSRHFDVRMTSYKNFLLILDLESKIPPTPNLSKIKPIFWQICKFLHFSVLQHIHNKRLPWQHLRLLRIVVMCKMTPISVRLNLKNFDIFCRFGVFKESLPGGRNFDIFCRFGVFKESLPGGRNLPPPR